MLFFININSFEKTSLLFPISFFSNWNKESFFISDFILFSKVLVFIFKFSTFDNLSKESIIYNSFENFSFGSNNLINLLKYLLFTIA